MIKYIAKMRYGLLLLLAIVVFGCLDEIDFEVPAENQTSLVIQGRLVKGTPHKISFQVERLFDFNGGSSFIRVDYVRITNDLGQTIDLENISLGNYEATIAVDDPDFEILSGGSFMATIQTLDERKFESNFEILHPVSKIDNMSTRIVQREVIVGMGTEIRDHLQFVLNTPLTIPNETDRARINWQVQRTYQLTDSPIDGSAPKTCYITDNVNIEEVQPFDGNILDIDYLTDYELYESAITYHFAEGYYLNVHQQSLSKGAFDYWNQIDQLLARDGSMFESPVGEIISNFENVSNPDEDVFGYFYATEIDTLNFRVDPASVDAPGIFCPPNVPPPPGGGCPIAVCCDCLGQPISTTGQPDYWE